MRKADPKHFKNIIVDEANILNWKGLIVPVSRLPARGHCNRYTRGSDISSGKDEAYWNPVILLAGSWCTVQDQGT